MEFKKILNKVLNGQDLDRNEAAEAMRLLMSGQLKPTQIAAFLIAMRMKGETIDEIVAFARVMREFALPVRPKISEIVVDVCGTGGDAIKTFNISTAAMFVAAGAGVRIAKHGNRSVSSKSGSADVLEALGAVIDLPPSAVERCIETVGIGFMFAPRYHPAMKYATPVRRELGVRTVFNILGPLTNPANAGAQLMGVFDGALTEKLAHVLRQLGCVRAMVVHGLDGLDELSTIGKTKVSELRDGRVSTRVIEPQELGLEPAAPSDIAGGDSAENARVIVQILRGERGPRRDIVLLNAAAAIYVSGLVDDLEEGLELARKSIDSGLAYRKLREFIQATGGDLARVDLLEEKHEHS
jgi:anthranilate phosphoribosyltransferase